MNDVLFGKPRWLRSFFEFMERIPIPGWVVAVLVIVISTTVHHLIAWQQGYLETGEFNFSLATHGFYFIFVPFSWLLLTKRAAIDLKAYFNSSFELV